MSGDTTLQSLKRLSYIPDRLPGYDGGTVIAGQEYNDVEFIGGAISNVTLTDVTINGTETARNLRNVTAAGSVTVQSDDYVIVIDKTVPEITTVTLPASPTAKRSLIIKDGQGQAGDFNITINGNGKTIDDQSSFTIAADWGAVEMEFNSAEDQWNVLNSYKEVGSGDVVGPVSATDNAVARFDGSTGRVIQNSAVTISDTTGVISGTQGVVFSGSISGTTTLQAQSTATGATLTLPNTTGILAISAGASIPTVAQGDLLYGSAANTLAVLPKNISASRYLANTGTDNNPAWSQVDLTNGVSGVLPSANGGTGVNNGSFTLTLSGNVAFTGAFNPTFSIPLTTTYTLPNLASATLATIGNLSQTFSGTTVFSGTFTTSGATATLGSSTDASTYGIGTGATLAATTKTINIGTAGVSTSITNVNIGSSVAGATGTTTVNTPLTTIAPIALATVTTPRFQFTAAADTTLTASTEASAVNFNLAAIRTHAAGAITTQRDFRIQSTTHAFATSSTITTASTLAISGAPIAGTNATITNAYALDIESGLSGFGGAIVPKANDGSAIGTTALQWSDLFLASGGVINWNNGTYTVTQSGTNLTFSGSITPSQTDGIVGTTTNNNASAGSVGEVVSSEVLFGSAVALTTGTTANVTSISLTAGDWDVSAMVGFLTNAATTVSFIAASLSDASATLQGMSLSRPRYDLAVTFAAGSDPSISLPTARISLASTTTIFLVATSTFAVNTNAAFGYIFARRAR